MAKEDLEKAARMFEAMSGPEKLRFVAGLLGTQAPYTREVVMNLADEFEYLEWSWCHSDFGPADGEVKGGMQARYEETTGKKVPKNWRYE